MQQGMITMNQNPKKATALGTLMKSSRTLDHETADEAKSASRAENRIPTRDPSATRLASREGKNTETADNQHPRKPENQSRLKDVMTENSTNSDDVDCSISAHNPLLGPVPSSRSISLRSNSSAATSTRSFAFPVLPPEWSGSPERMVETEQSQLRKRPRWKMYFVCCKF